MTIMSRPPADPSELRRTRRQRLHRRLLLGLQDSKGSHQGPGGQTAAHERKRPWWQVMCLTGVDYFSTATSRHRRARGRRHFPAGHAGWGGKLFVLVLLGFAATDFMITMAISAADAVAHLIQNPYAPAWLQGQEVTVTLVLLALLAAVFLRGFKEAIGIAVVLVPVYLGLNVVAVARAAVETLGC